MAETVLEGRRAVLVGAAGELRAAIEAALRAAGATVRLADDARALATGGGADIVVHLARRSVPLPFLDRSDEAWSADLDARVAEPIRVARAATGALSGGGGALVFVGTPDAVHAYHGHADASVGMGALAGLVRSLAVELAPIGVRANMVLVGPMEEATPDAGVARRDRTLLRSPSGRFVTAEEAAAAVLFVAGPGAAFMTGSTLRVDAGWASLNQAPDGMRFA